MGVTTCQYLIYGAKFPYIDYDEELYDKYGCSAYDKDKEGKVIELSDGYGSTYTIIGKCIKKSERHEAIYDIIEFNKLPEMDDKSIAAINEAVEAFGLTVGPNLEYGYMVLTHYS